jgi:ABC-type microcin C transport system permease subunit YejE
MAAWLRRPPPRLEELHPDPNRATLQVLAIAVPRMLRSSVVTAVTFLLGSALFGVEIGAVLAMIVVGTIFVLDRRAGRAGFVAGLVLAFVFVSGLVAVLSRSLSMFFLPAAAVDAVMGIACLVTVLLGRPLFGAATADFFTVPDALMHTDAHVRGARRMTYIAAAFFLGRAAMRLAAFFLLPTGWFVAVSIAGEIIFDVLLAFLGVRLNISRMRELSLGELRR